MSVVGKGSAKKNSKMKKPHKKFPAAGARFASAKYINYAKIKHHFPKKKKGNLVLEGGKPESHMKKATYSKAARSAVLANAGARQRLIELGGENTISIIREFDRDMSDEELSRKTGIRASDVRVVLNRLHNHGLFFYTRVRDKDSGWYSYIWKMGESRLKDFVSGLNVEVGESAQLVEGEVYVCRSCEAAAPLAFDQASDLQFKCSRCGAALEYYEQKKSQP